MIKKYKTKIFDNNDFFFLITTFSKKEKINFLLIKKYLVCMTELLKLLFFIIYKFIPKKGFISI